MTTAAEKGTLIVSGVGTVIVVLAFFVLRSADPGLSPTDPRWVPRIKDEDSQIIRLGQCGQVHAFSGGRPIWHRIECPK